MRNVLVGLDRDGAINLDVHDLGKEDNWREQVVMLDGVFEGLRLLREPGINYNLSLAVVSNQAGVARGFFDESRVGEVNREINARLLKEEINVGSWHFCPYYSKSEAADRARRNPEDNMNPDYILENHDPKLNLRKPATGMLRDACEVRDWDYKKMVESGDIYIIGDKLTDAQTAVHAGGTGILLGNTIYRDDLRDLELCQERDNIVIEPNFYSAARFIIQDLEKKS